MKAPVYVKIDKYQEVEEMLSQIKAKIEEAKGAISKLNEIKAEEEHDLQAWQGELSEVEDKISSIEHSMER